MAPDDLMDSTATAFINATIESVDMADWLFHLADAE